MQGHLLSRLRIAPRIALLVLLGAGGVLAAVVFFSEQATDRILLGELERRSRTLAEATAARIWAVERGVEQTAKGLALALARPGLSRQETERILESAVASDPEVFGAAYARDASAPGGRAAPYVFRTPEGTAKKDLAEGNYEFEKSDWWLVPREKNAPGWTEPYFDRGGGDILMATYAVPVREMGTGRVTGVATCDVSLGWLTQLLSSLPLGEEGYAWLLSPRGTFLGHRERTYVGRGTVFEFASRLGRPDLDEIGRRMVAGESGWKAFRSMSTGKDSFIAFTPVATTGWSLAVVQPRAAVTGVVRSLEAIQLGIGAIGFVLLLAVVLGVAATITRPLRKLEEATAVLSAGGLDAPLPEVPGSDEVAQLSRSFRRMQADLAEHVERLQVTTAARERLENELRIAHEIQLSLVPSVSVLAGLPGLDISALLDPARHVGGDLYDFVPLSGNRLFLAIGDVSGKGVPAALQMTATRALVRYLVREGEGPGGILSRVNAALTEVDTGMFVTLFCCILDLDTGRSRYSLAGHNPPLLCRAGGGVEPLALLTGPPAGILADSSYSEGTFSLLPGDVLLLYTDGLTEAMSPSRELFGDERTAEALARLASRPCDAIVRGLREEVRSFANGAPQSDDIALLAVRRLAAAGSGL